MRLANRLTRVGDQVDDHLVKLVPIACHGRCRRDLLDESDARRHGRAHQLERIAQHGGNIDALPTHLAVFFAAEREDLFHQVARASRAEQYGVEAAAIAAVLGQMARHHLGQGDHRYQRVVDFMRGAARQRTQRFEALGVMELRLEGPPFGFGRP